MSLIFRPTQPASTPAGGLGWAWTELSGPDARDFLQRLTTVNLLELEPGNGRPGFFLNAQGRIESSFHLWNLGENRYAFEYEAGEGGKERAKLAEWIERYHFAEKFTVTHPELSCAWVLEGPPRGTHASIYENAVRLCDHGSRDYGRSWISVWGESSAVESWLRTAQSDAKEIPLAHLELWRIEASGPRPGHELIESANPLEAGYREGIAENKGCYPGQEVIEKIISIGSPARRLVRVEGEGEPPAPGAKLSNLAEPPSEVGEITSSAARGKDFVALGYVRKIHAKPGLEITVGGRRARIGGA